MKFLVFPQADTATLMDSIKFAFRINIDLAENVVIRETQRKARLYTDGAWEEYEIARIVEFGKDKYYIVGKLLEECKADYPQALENNLKEVLV